MLFEKKQKTEIKPLSFHTHPSMGNVISQSMKKERRSIVPHYIFEENSQEASA